MRSAAACCAAARSRRRRAFSVRSRRSCMRCMTPSLNGKKGMLEQWRCDRKSTRLKTSSSSHCSASGSRHTSGGRLCIQALVLRKRMQAAHLLPGALRRGARQASSAAAGREHAGEVHQVGMDAAVDPAHAPGACCAAGRCRLLVGRERGRERCGAVRAGSDVYHGVRCQLCAAQRCQAVVLPGGMDTHPTAEFCSGAVS